MSSYDSASFQNHPNGVGTTSAMDPTTFMANNASFDPSQFQNQQLQQRMQNGSMRNGSPGFSNPNPPQYQTNQVIPSKRPREASLGTSPRQAPGMLPNSRSQTPQQSHSPYPGFQQNNGPPQHNPQQPPYSHLQNGSANASPSPIMTNQLRPGGVPQRVSTASPHPFSPAGQQYAPQPSPSQSDHGRSDSATPISNQYAQNPAFAPGFNPNSFTPPSGRSSAPPQNGMPIPQMPQPQQMFAQQHGQQPQPGQQPRQTEQQMKMMQQMRLQQQLQQANLMNAQRGNMPANANPLARPPMQGPNGVPIGIPPQQTRAPNPDQFMKSLSAFMQSKGLPLDIAPPVADRQVPLMSLYMAVLKFGGFGRVMQGSGWTQVGAALGFQPQQYPNVGMQLRAHYEQYLLAFEKAWQENQMKQRQVQQQQAARAMGGGQTSPMKPMDPQQAMSQQQYMQQQFLAQQQQQQQARLQQHHAQSTPGKQMGPMRQPGPNGFSTPQPPHSQPGMGPQVHSRNSLSRSLDSRGVSSPQPGGPFAMPSPISASKPGSMSVQSPQVDASIRHSVKSPSEGVDLPDKLVLKYRDMDTFGGIDLKAHDKLGRQLIDAKPDIPALIDLGLIDMHALTMSLQCGIPSEVRLALDTIALLSKEVRYPIDLRHCEDLVETLIDCAEIQVEALAESAAEVSDVMFVTSYEDIVRGCRQEDESVSAIHAFGSHEYALDRAVDRLLCITSILRNLTFHDTNAILLADELVIKFICVVIRHLGTRNMLLRTNNRTLEFMKDISIFLSNLANLIELPGREQALCLLHFVLAFTPCPPPNVAGPEIVTFPSYDATTHPYLGSALDVLAKLLARDEPNRTFYRIIFATDGVSSSPPYDLLTKSFGLAISVIPDERQIAKRGLHSLVEARKPLLMQGMLAAEILSNLAPGFETGVARSWLTSDDGFARNLSHLVMSLTLDTPPKPPPQSRAPPMLPRGLEDDGNYRIAVGGIAVLHRLTEKCKDPEDPMSSVPLSGMPSKMMLLQAMQTESPRLQKVLNDLCAYMGLDI